MAWFDIVVSVVIILVLALITEIVISSYFYYVPKKEFVGAYTYMIYVFRICLGGIIYNGVSCFVTLVLIILIIVLFYTKKDIGDDDSEASEDAYENYVDTSSRMTAKLPSKRPSLPVLKKRYREPQGHIVNPEDGRKNDVYGHFINPESKNIGNSSNESYYHNINQFHPVNMEEKNQRNAANQSYKQILYKRDGLLYNA